VQDQPAKEGQTEVTSDLRLTRPRFPGRLM
jgi:hypothetical protein